MTSQVPHVSTTALADRALSVKKRFLAMYLKANAGHIGSSLSCAELLVLLRFGWMRQDDVLVLSKGHAAAALYSVLAESGALTTDQIDSFYAEGTQLPALPPVNAIREIPFATGSLGHGLSLSAGMALGARLDRRDRRYYCVTSDGELDEGSVWEAALFIAHHRLASVVWIIDRNQLQGIGRTEDVLALEPLDAKLRAFGFHVVIADGHDFEALLAARDECAPLIEAGRAPVVIIANTIKGNGIGYLQGTIDSHYLPMNRRQYEQALDEITRAHAAATNGSGRAH
jgi:transketolase